MIRAHDWRLLGAVGYWLFDNLVLYACLAAFGPAPSFWIVAMAYLVGMLANSLPVPGGFVAVEGGLATHDPEPFNKYLSHPRASNEAKAALMMSQTSPKSPERSEERRVGKECW